MTSSGNGLNRIINLAGVGLAGSKTLDLGEVCTILKIHGSPEFSNVVY